MASTRYLVLRYNQLRAKLRLSGVREDASFTEADDRELTRIYDVLSSVRRDQVEAVCPGAYGGSDLRLRHSVTR
jgi:hypothetical protein